MLVRVGAHCVMWMEVRMTTVVVLVLVDMEESCPPAVEQARCQVDDHDADHRFRALLEALGQVLVERPRSAARRRRA